MAKNRPVTQRERKFSSSSVSTDDEHHDISEQIVSDVTLEFFYKPRTITALCCLSMYLIYFASTQ